jgi:hypothetical protein
VKDSFALGNDRMSESEFKDVAEATISCLTEDEMAAWRREQGANVIQCHGQYWERSHHGFYSSTHWLARMRSEEARRPVAMCWGYRAALCDADIGRANGVMPVHLLKNVKDYDLSVLSSNRRYKLRKGQRLAKFVQLIEPGLLREQGYDLLCSVGKRLGRYRPASREAYLAGLERHVRDSRRIILAGLINGTLAACVEGHAVGRTAYIQFVYIATSALNTEVGTGLVFEFVQICRRSGQVEEIVYGQHARENESLNVYKESIGFPVVRVPTRVSISPIVAQYIRWQKPHVFYRLTGRG